MTEYDKTEMDAGISGQVKSIGLIITDYAGIEFMSSTLPTTALSS